MMDCLLQCVSLFQKVGYVMYLLMACSLAVAAITVERLLYYRFIFSGIDEFFKKLELRLAQQRISEVNLII